jgi:N-acetylglutamate synthase-like GNAT family acetyltransferase
LGGELMALLVETARQLGLARVELEATADGQSVYEKAGFTVQPSVHVPMELVLTPAAD